MRHLVYISVVGADRVPVVSTVDRAMFGYFESKLAAERVVAESGVPYTTLRATQFHDLLLTTVRGMAKLPVIPVPSGFQVQPVDTTEVAARLVELTLGAPAGLVPDIAGPRTYRMADAGPQLPEGPPQAPGAGAAAAARPGAPARSGRARTWPPDRAVGRRTWEGFLAEQVG